MNFLANKNTGSGGLLLLIFLGLAILGDLLIIIGLPILFLMEDQIGLEDIPTYLIFALALLAVIIILRVISYIGIFYYIKEGIVGMWSISIFIFICFLILSYTILQENSIYQVLAILVYPIIITILIRPIRPYFHKLKSPLKDKFVGFFVDNKKLILWTAGILIIIPCCILLINQIDFKKETTKQTEIETPNKLEAAETFQENVETNDGFILEANLNYKIQVKKGVKNVNIRDSYIVEQSKILSQISFPETYTVTKKATIKDKSNAIYLLNTKTQLTDTYGRNYTFEPGKKVKVLNINGQFYNAEIELDKQTINVKIPLDNVESQNEQNWLFLKELNGWVLSRFIEESGENTNNTSLRPQEIDYDGKPDLEYQTEGIRTVLEGYNENDDQSRYIRMKFNGKEVLLKNITSETSKFNRVYRGNGYNVTFKIKEYGKCAGEGSQYLFGEVIIESNGKFYTTGFQGSDPYYSSKECQEVGNG